ncbi:MAG: hypothetical protein K0R73_1016 [Candidatus Midichloriaceae bacterium]|jgi:hypothetical protein|nr:hypothetical protein [Candidatus Midichloriaceae bacterium]
MLEVHKEIYTDLKEMILSHSYTEIMNDFQEMEEAKLGDEITSLLNFQDPEGKTLIHHIVENHNTGHRTGLWAMVELSFKGADLNIQDKQGNTALHSCANFYKTLISAPFNPEFDTYLHQSLIEDQERAIGKDKEREMFAFMADIGGMLWCGANPEIANNKGEKIFPLMASIAKLMPAGSVKPNICAESCKLAFIEFFNKGIQNFLYEVEEKQKEFNRLHCLIKADPLSEQARQSREKLDANLIERLALQGDQQSLEEYGIRYSWAPNVKKWVEELEANASPEIKSAKFALEPPGKHVTKVTAQPEQQSSGCTLF